MMHKWADLGRKTGNVKTKLQSVRFSEYVCGARVYKISAHNLEGLGAVHWVIPPRPGTLTEKRQP